VRLHFVAREPGVGCTYLRLTHIPQLTPIPCVFP
jgi:hypothetical protein